MVKYTQAIRRQQTMNRVSQFDHFPGLALKGLLSYGFFEYQNKTHFNEQYLYNCQIKGWNKTNTKQANG